MSGSTRSCCEFLVQVGQEAVQGPGGKGESAVSGGEVRIAGMGPRGKWAQKGERAWWEEALCGWSACMCREGLEIRERGDVARPCS